MKKVRILYISQTIGGLNIHLRNLIENIDNNIFEVHLLHGKNEQFNFKNTELQKVETKQISLYRSISILDIVAIFQTIIYIYKIKPDIIHAHSSKGGIVGRVAGFVTNTTTFFTPHAFSYLSTSNKFKRFLYLSIEKFLSKLNNYLIASSESEYKRGINEVKYKSSKSLIVKNGINDLYHNYSIDFKSNEIFLCTITRYTYQKNVELIIEILNELNKKRDIYLNIIEVGYFSPDFEKIKKIINKYNLNSKIRIFKNTDLSRKEVLQTIKNSKLYLSTSRYEGLPYSVMESISLGIPCVVSNCDGNRDLIINDYNGFVIDGEEPYKFSEKIELLLADKELYEKFSNNANRFFKENFSIENNIKDLENAYLKVMAIF